MGWGERIASPEPKPAPRVAELHCQGEPPFWRDGRPPGGSCKPFWEEARDFRKLKRREPVRAQEAAFLFLSFFFLIHQLAL